MTGLGREREHLRLAGTVVIQRRERDAALLELVARPGDPTALLAFTRLSEATREAEEALQRSIEQTSQLEQIWKHEPAQATEHTCTRLRAVSDGEPGEW